MSGAPARRAGAADAAVIDIAVIDIAVNRIAHSIVRMRFGNDERGSVDRFPGVDFEYQADGLIE